MKSSNLAFNNPKVRSVLAQVLTLVVTLLFFFYIVENLFDNISKRGISTGFDFLDVSANFIISSSLIEFKDSDTYARVFLVGILNTILVSFTGIVIATILGFIIGVARVSNNFIVSKLSQIYIELFRNIPVLLQILFWYNILLSILPSPRKSINIFDSIFINVRGLYLPNIELLQGFNIFLISLVSSIFLWIFYRKWAYKKRESTGKNLNNFVPYTLILLLPLIVFFMMGSPVNFELPVLKGFNFKGGVNIVPEFLALTLALSIYTATYIAEAVRSGIEAVPKGQKEAASSLGLSKSLILKMVVIPQAMRVIIPPVINQYLNLTKNSSLAAAIGYPELVTTFAGTTLNQVGQAVEIILMTMLVYLSISIFISILLNIYNKSTKIKER